MFILLYEGEEVTKAAAETAVAEALARKAEAEAQAKQEEETKKEKKAKSFTQDEMNMVLANDRRKHEEKLKKTVTDLELLRKSQSLTEQEKTDLEGQINELNDQFLSKEQLASKEKVKLETTYKKKMTDVETDRDTWKKRYTDSLITNAIQKAAVEHDAFDSSQISALILSKGPQVVEDADGNFVPKVQLKTTKNKEEVTLDLTISEVVENMKEKKENANLFKASSSGGLGLDSGSGRGDSDQPPLNDPAAYRKWRKKNLIN